MTMPLHDGQETPRRLRELASSLPVLMTSGYNEQLAINVLRRTDATSFIPKPYTVAMLANALEDMLSHARGGA